MESFSLKNIAPDRFVTKVRRSLLKGPLKGLVTFTQSSETEIHITFSQFGKSHIYYNIENTDKGFTAKRAKEKIAMTHGAFRKQVESELSTLLKRLGAEVG